MYRDFRTFKRRKIIGGGGYKNINHTRNYTGSNLNINALNKALVERLRKQTLLVLQQRVPKMFFWRLKKKFKQINRDNRLVVLKNFKLNFKNKHLTWFILQTKNTPKRILFGELINRVYKKNNIWNYILFPHKNPEPLLKDFGVGLQKHSLVLSYSNQKKILDTYLNTQKKKSISKFIFRKTKQTIHNRTIFDFKQLVAMEYKPSTPYAVDYSDMWDHNVWNLRTYNWKVIT